MKKSKILGVLIICASILHSQTSEKPITVRIKKVENINGVEKVSDTTYSTNDLSTIKTDEASLDFIDYKVSPGSNKKVVVIRQSENKPEIVMDNEPGGPAESLTMTTLDDGSGKPTCKRIILNDPSDKNQQKTTLIQMDNNSPEAEAELKTIEKALKEAGIETNLRNDQTIYVSEDVQKTNDGSPSKKTKIVIFKKYKLAEPNAEDTKALGKSAGISDNKLALDKIDFYPNPNNGKFNLSFDLKEKGNTTVSIMSVDGKIIFSESLIDFTGHYNKEIDISENPKGIYFVKVEQGKHAQLKKLVLE